MGDRHSVTARTIGEPGRYLLEGAGRLLLSDSALIRQVPSVAPGPIDLLVSALGSCAVASVESDARDNGIVLAGISATVTSERDDTDETRFRSIRVDIKVAGVDQKTADRLTHHLTGHCPIFNTLRRGGGDVTADITAVAVI